METALDGKAELIIDLRELRFLDSQGLDSLLRASRQAKEHAVVLRLVPGPRTVDRIFDLTDTRARFEFVDLSPHSDG